MEGIGNTRSIEITKLALDGLSERHKAIAANTANVMTPGYQRSEVAFEDQLRDVIYKEDYKTNVKRANSAALSYNATLEDIQSRPTQSQVAITNQNVYNAFNPEIIKDTSQYNPETGNNVDIEKEMMDMAKTGVQYSLLAKLEGKMFEGLSTVIRSGGN